MTELTANTRVGRDTTENEGSLGAVLWDMDGTLIDSEPLWMAAEDSMLARYGLTMSDEDRLRLIGSGLWDAAELFRTVGVPLSAEEIISTWVTDILASLREGGVAWRPGARELLASLKAEGVPSALVTMSFRAVADVIAELLPVGTFTAIVAGDQVQHSKPHPEPYLLGAAALGVPIERCLAFEDSPTGLRSAYSSGAVAIGVPNMLELNDQPAHELWPTLAGLDAAALKARFTELRRG